MYSSRYLAFLGVFVAALLATSAAFAATEQATSKAPAARSTEEWMRAEAQAGGKKVATSTDLAKPSENSFVFGAVSSVNGSMLTVAVRHGYAGTTTGEIVTVDASEVDASRIVAGDLVRVRGAKSGSTIVASEIGVQKMGNASSTASTTRPSPEARGFWKKFGDFFRGIFGTKR